MPSEDVYSDDWWLDRNDQNRCVAVRKNGERCLKPANRGMTVCRTHGGAAPQVQRKAKQRLELAADRMARELLGMATGAESEAVKLNAIRDALDRAGLGARTEVSVELKPYERLLGDLSGVASITRAEHRAQQGRPFVSAPALAAPIDVEVVETPDVTGPAAPPERPESEMRYPGEADDDGDDMPRGTGLMTLEEAAETIRHEHGYKR
ncbi:hypothetical protein [Mycobacteroides abscessus]|uniref:hypothetical protein n=2 Tax=Mycobacteroides abscessus TaxID=36809 RepID=UPI00092858F4|nr:hypothetical protein [Mycobacteroides abscessus]MBE5451639.1 hypothetical protein [Mycobacteroides abscessus]MBE5466760.1 hypothetical protein [Mycobacteroides abscessus]MBN7366747.1 hypothetical protein [Mycobacteroides abscessus subsp. abscessus]MBN7450382.1 hypothetical protein [Mycobacteroides abscessus subsp. abscessus]MBN7490993.1 hypothetical protein [Mycobacteroides abscessus subsp. abscessus]